MNELAGHERIAEGREAEIYEWGDGLVLRLMRSAADLPAMKRSTVAIAAARTFDVATPAVLEVVEIDGRPGQVMERVDGIDQFSVMAGRPWTLPSIGVGLGRIHADLHRPEVPDELPSIHELIESRIQESARVPADIAAAALVALEDLPHGRSLCHGDFHPGNVLVTDRGPVLIDWTNAARGPAMADFARTRLMLTMGELPPGSPALIRALAVVGRGVLHRLYIRGYRRAGALDMELAARWEPVRAADRLGEEIEGERDALLVIARRGLGLAAGS